MSNGLTVYSDPSAVESIEKLGAMIARGGLYNCKNEQQGATLVLMAHTEGLPIAEMRKRYHIINSKHGSDLSMRADWMLAEFRRLGGEFTWPNQGDDGKQATIHVRYLTNDIDVTFTIEDAKRQGLVKDGSNWTKNPGAMLRSRAITKAIRMVCPEVLAGFATEDEIDPDSDAIPAEVLEMRRVATPPAEPKGGDPKSVTPPAAAATEEVIEEAEFTPIDPDAGKITGKQLARISELFKALEMGPEVQLACAKKRGAESVATLTEEMAADLLSALEAKYKAKLDAEVEPSANDGQATSEPIDAPASQPKIDRIRSLFEQLAQTEGNADIATRVREKLQHHGVPKMSALTETSADEVIKVLSAKNLDAFFALELQAAKNG